MSQSDSDQTNLAPAQSSKRSILQSIFISPEEKRLRAGWRLLVHLLFMLVAGFLFTTPVAIASFYIKFDMNLVGQFSTGLGIVVGTWAARRWIDKRSFSSLGLKVDPMWWKDILAGIGIAALLHTFIFIAHLGTGWLTFSGFAWQSMPVSQLIVEMLGVLTLFLAVGFYEELMSRGYHLQNLEDGFNLVWVIAIPLIIGIEFLLGALVDQPTLVALLQDAASLWIYLSFLLVKFLFYSFIIFSIIYLEKILLRRNYSLTLNANTKTAWAVFYSSAIFGVMHIANPSATWISSLGILVAGLFLAYPYLRTRQLWMSVGLHIGWNFFLGPVFGFPVSGLETPRLILHEVTGPAWFTGGAFGPEAGMSAIFAMLIGAVLIYYYTQKRLLNTSEEQAE